MTEDQLRTWTRSGVAGRDGRGVWRLRGVPETTEQQAMAAVLHQGHGALLARSSAAWLWDVPGHPLGPIDVLHRRDEHMPTAARRHTSRCLDDVDSTVRRGIPVTTPTRTLFDLAGQQHPLRTRRDLNNLMARGLVTLPLLDGCARSTGPPWKVRDRGDEAPHRGGRSEGSTCGQQPRAPRRGDPRDRRIPSPRAAAPDLRRGRLHCPGRLRSIAIATSPSRSTAIGSTTGSSTVSWTQRRALAWSAPDGPSSASPNRRSGTPVSSW